jgi:anthranilate synthase component II
MILLLDNYDSFTFNLYQSLATLGPEVQVVRNDAKSAAELVAMQPSAVVISPGPGIPSKAGELPGFLAALPEEVPLLGVCLGHQALVEHYGGKLEFESEPVHGKGSLVHHDGSELYTGLPNPFPAGRYHSLRADRATLPEELILTAWTEDGVVMGVRHRDFPRFGVQFHPESILTPLGDQLLAHFLAISGEAVSVR